MGLNRRGRRSLKDPGVGGKLRLFEKLAGCILDWLDTTTCPGGGGQTKIQLEKIEKEKSNCLDYACRFAACHMPHAELCLNTLTLGAVEKKDYTWMPFVLHNLPNTMFLFW